MNFRIQSITKDDKDLFSNFTCVADWTKKDVLHYLALETSLAWGFLKADAQEITGFILVSRVIDEIEILTIETRADMQRQGVATILLNYLFHYAREEKIQQIFLEVKVTNLSAQSLYEKCGFESYGIRKNYYASTDGSLVDAILYRMVLNDQEKKIKIKLD